MAAVPLIAALGTYQVTGQIDAAVISLLVLGLLGALAVALTRNLSVGWRRFSKFLIGALATLVTALITALITGDLSAASWATLITGVLTSCLVWLVKYSEESASAGSRGDPAFHRKV